MSSLDDLLSAAIAEGKAALAEKKKPRVPAKEKREQMAKILTEQIQRVVTPPSKGLFEITCLVAEYVRRTCQNCKHTELCSVPRVFICEQQVGVPTTRLLHRVHKQETVISYIEQGYPVKTEVFTSPAPFCRHCVKELINARRPSPEGVVQTQGEHPLEPVSEPVSGETGAVPTAAPTPVPPRSDQSVHHETDRAGPPGVSFRFLPILFQPS